MKITTTAGASLGASGSGVLAAAGWLTDMHLILQVIATAAAVWAGIAAGAYSWEKRKLIKAQRKRTEARELLHGHDEDTD